CASKFGAGGWDIKIEGSNLVRNEFIDFCGIWCTRPRYFWRSKSTQKNALVRRRWPGRFYSLLLSSFVRELLKIHP
ncbi:hypothetical protein, partial [Vibrio gazogenes]|uniref:hypothetical protein n=1 Tax=Vibrio gazogenes TaxID=687 RepID=UPI001A965489